MLHCPRINRAHNSFVQDSFWPQACAPRLAADPTGDWRVADGVANIRVAQCNGSMWGVVAWEKTPGGTRYATIRMPPSRAGRRWACRS